MTNEPIHSSAEGVVRSREMVPKYSVKEIALIYDDSVGSIVMHCHA